MTIVLDSWAVLRLLEDEEPAASRVSAVLAEQRPVMSWINLGEVFYILRRRHGEQEALDTVHDVRTSVDAGLPSVDLVIESGRIKSDHPLAYADAFAAATAIAHDALLLTGDPELLVDGSRWRWEDLRPA